VADASLVATMDANLDRFNQKMGEAGQTADRSVKAIEDRLQQANPDMSAMFTRLVGQAEAGGGAVAAVLAGTIIGGITLVIEPVQGPEQHR
jgi:hypothetical protein